MSQNFISRVSKYLNSQSLEIGLFSIQGNKRIGTLSIVLVNNAIESVVTGTVENDASVTFIDQGRVKKSVKSSAFYSDRWSVYGVVNALTVLRVIVGIISIVLGIMYFFQMFDLRFITSIYMQLLLQVDQDLLSVLDPIQKKSLEVQSLFQKFTTKATNANIPIRKDVKDSTSEVRSNIQHTYT